MMVSKGKNSLLWPYFRLVNYNNLPRFMLRYMVRSEFYDILRTSPRSSISLPVPIFGWCGWSGTMGPERMGPERMVAKSIPWDSYETLPRKVIFVKQRERPPTTCGKKEFATVRSRETTIDFFFFWGVLFLFSSVRYQIFRGLEVTFVGFRIWPTSPGIVKYREMYKTGSWIDKLVYDTLW